MTSNRILELAKEWKVFVQTPAELEAFYKAAHADGQRAMRERAAKSCSDNYWDAGLLFSEAIRNLEITE